MSVKMDKDEEGNSGSGVAVVETNRFGFILGNGETDSDAPCPELVRHREIKWLGLIKQWDQVMEKKNNKVKGQCQKGIPTSVRARCWPLLCGALGRMKQNEKLYERLVEAPDQQGWTDIIKRDTDRQFPFHEMFLSKDGHGQQNLLQVLKAYTQYKPEEGYCQGQGPVAAVLLMNMPAEEAFWCLAQISEHYLPGYYSPLLEGVLFDAAVLSSVLKKLCPAAHKHLQNQGVEPLMFATDWLMCLYSRHLPFNTLLRVWDLFFCYGVRVLFQVAVVLVRRCLGEGRQRKECDGQMETLEVLRGVKQRVQNDQTDAFIHEVCSVPLSSTDLQKQIDKEMEKWKKERPDSTFDPRGRCHGYRMAWERVQNKQKENEKKDRVKASLTLPLMRSHSSLSPSGLRKKWRKRRSKTDTEEWDGGGRKFSQGMMEESDDGEMRRRSVCGVVGEQRAKQDRLADELHTHKQKDHSKDVNISVVVTSSVDSDVFEEEREETACVSQTQGVMETDSRCEDKLHTHRDNHEEDTESPLIQQKDNSPEGQDKRDAEKIAACGVLESKETHNHEPISEGETCQDEQILERETSQDEKESERETREDEPKSERDEAISERETCKDGPISERETCKDGPISERKTCQDEPILERETSQGEQKSERETCEDEPISKTDTCENEPKSERDEPISERETCQDGPISETETCEDKPISETETYQDKQKSERELNWKDQQNIEKQEHQNEQNVEVQITSITSDLGKENIPTTETSQANYDLQKDIQNHSGKQEEEIQSDSNNQKDEIQEGDCKPKGPEKEKRTSQKAENTREVEKSIQNQENTLETEEQTHVQDSRTHTYSVEHEDDVHLERQKGNTETIGEIHTDVEKARVQRNVVSDVQIPEEREITEHSNSTRDDNTGSEENRQEISLDERDRDSHKASKEMMQTCETVPTSSSVKTESEFTVQSLDRLVQQFQTNNSHLESKEVEVTLSAAEIPNSQVEDTTVASEDGDMDTAAVATYDISELSPENSAGNKTALSENAKSCEVISTEKSSNLENKGEFGACISGNPENNDNVGNNFGKLGDKDQLKDGSANLESNEVHVTAQSGNQESNVHVKPESGHPGKNTGEGSGNPRCDDSAGSGNDCDSQLESSSSSTPSKIPNIPPAHLCLRRMSSSKTSYPTILSEDTFREPKQMSTDHMHTSKETNTPMTDVSSPLIRQPEMNNTSKPENTQVTKSDTQTKTSTPKRLGLFRRLRGDAKKTPVPKILIQDFSDKEEKLTSKERRRRKREQERKEREEKERKKQEKEKDKQRERKKPQTRGKSFQVLNRKCAENDVSSGSVDSQAVRCRRNSAPFSDSYF
ncbi:transcriptional regulator ATRX [Triplophysa rosa]|nr:transcriptional regulator ATRX [Triplophysa rosa]